MFGKTAALEKIIDSKNTTIEALNDKVRELESENKMSEEKFELKEKKAVAALEDRLAKKTAKLEKEYNDKLHSFKEDQLAKQSAKLETSMTENYSKLKDELAKLHSDGNATTKYMQEMTKEILRTVGMTTNTVNRNEKLEVIEAPKKKTTKKK